MTRRGLTTPPDARRTGDTAYIGTPISTPTRKPRGGELTSTQKEENRKVSRRRSASERYRNPTRRHTLIMKNVAGLHNLMHA